MEGWQKRTKVTVPAGGNIDVSLPGGRPVLEKLTIWAVSRDAVSALSFQAKLNSINFGAAVVHAGPGKLAIIVFDSGDGAADAFLIPVGTAALGDIDPFGFVLNIASTHGSDQEVTLYFAGIGHPGG
jgi:hypothetical protein